MKLSLLLLTSALGLVGVAAMGWGYGDDCVPAYSNCLDRLECKLQTGGGYKCVWSETMACTSWHDCPEEMGYDAMCEGGYCSCIPGSSPDDNGSCQCDDPVEQGC
eukprot:TRINITY_DN733_c0_g1_i2.p4 TRINITY_DN733_c0_g1~~TRINITY_DN733_c0_g1_i2.p4  ORF type:complete len:105 (+),score=21.13 TRINITY_DN733_c0_g1_i2:481-795(+)